MNYIPAVYLFSGAAAGGGGMAYSMAEDGTVLGEHFCSHRGYMRHDLHDRPDRLKATRAYYPDGYRLVVLMGEGEVPPPDVMERNRRQADRSEDEAIEHERKPRCYIAGPIAGVPDFRERFAAAVPVVEELGYEPVNPCDITPAVHDGPCPPGYDPGANATGHTSSACFMRADLRALLDCDAIYMLPGWQESRGATVERSVAVACGMTILGARA